MAKTNKMIVKTKNPIRIITNSKDNYSNIDAKNKDEVKAFQDWLDIKYPSGWAISASGAKYIVNKKASNGYGNYGKSTTAAYITDGAEWEKTRPKQEPKKEEPKQEPKKDDLPKDETKKDEITVTKDDKGNTITTTKKADGTILTVVTDKNGKEILKKESGMSKKLKIGLMIGGGVLVLLIMAAIIKQAQK